MVAAISIETACQAADSRCVISAMLSGYTLEYEHPRARDVVSLRNVQTREDYQLDPIRPRLKCNRESSPTPQEARTVLPAPDGSWPRFRHGECRVLSILFSVLAFMAASCGIRGQYDATALREDRACLVPTKVPALDPPLGEYEDQGISLDYDRLVPQANPREGADISYYKSAHGDPQSVEQLYYDASQGNPRAQWLICIMEASARFIGREAARYMAGLKCQTVVNCRLYFDKLPFSQDMPSGARLLAEVGKGFISAAEVQSAEQELIGHALVLLVGANVAASSPKLRGRLPASTSGPATSSSSRALGRALEAAGHVKPPGYATHHIVAENAAAAAPARAVLRRFGIGINEAPNGVFLPAKLATPNAAGAAVHSRLHTQAYYRVVNRRLNGATTRQEALDALEATRQALLDGGF